MANFQQGGALLINADYNLSGAVNFVTAPTVGPLTATGQPNASSLVGTNDANGVNRIVINPTAKTIANASATALFNVTRTSIRRGGEGDWVSGVCDRWHRLPDHHGDGDVCPRR